MTEFREHPQALLAELATLDTPTVCNALEIVAPKRRGFGYTVEPLFCLHPDLPPMVGYARTARIRAAHPVEAAGSLQRQLSDDYYQYIDDGPKPSVVMIEDLDGPQRGYGSFWGEVNSHIHRGLGALGVITNGSIRDLPDNAEGFQMMADRVGPSHAFVHVVDFDVQIQVSGMRVAPLDLIHADQHGAVVIPHEVATEVPAAAAQIARRERVIIDAAKQTGFSADKLKKAQGEAAEIH